jgi:DnaJ-class molecular chaperone
MAQNKTCTECNGTGKYKVFNAYEPTFEEEVLCEYCLPKPKSKPSPYLN